QMRKEREELSEKRPRCSTVVFRNKWRSVKHLAVPAHVFNVDRLNWIRTPSSNYSRFSSPSLQVRVVCGAFALGQLRTVKPKALLCAGTNDSCRSSPRF